MRFIRRENNSTQQSTWNILNVNEVWIVNILFACLNETAQPKKEKKHKWRRIVTRAHLTFVRTYLDCVNLKPKKCCWNMCKFAFMVLLAVCLAARIKYDTTGILTDATNMRYTATYTINICKVRTRCCMCGVSLTGMKCVIPVSTYEIHANKLDCPLCSVMCGVCRRLYTYDTAVARLFAVFSSLFLISFSTLIHMECLAWHIQCMAHWHTLIRVDGKWIFEWIKMRKLHGSDSTRLMCLREALMLWYGIELTSKHSLFVS